MTASGTAPLSYQWQKEEVDLADGGNIAGATTPNLNLSNAQISDGGNYRVVVTNAFGATTSAVAVLSVNPAPIPPSIVTPPTNQTVAASNANFMVARPALRR